MNLKVIFFLLTTLFVYFSLPSVVDCSNRNKKSSGNSCLLFVQLKDFVEKEETDYIGDVFRNMFLSGGLQVGVFQPEPSKLLFTLQEDECERAEDVYNFLVSRKEVGEIQWQGRPAPTTKLDL